VETKTWKSSAELARAAKYASYLRALGVNGAYVVVPKLKREQIAQGVVSVQGFRKVLGQLTSGIHHVYSSDPLPTQSGRIIFAAMPFGKEYDDVFFVAIRAAAKSAGTAAKRVDKDDYSGDVVERIKDRIAQASAIVVDLSDCRPNVLYEMGFAHGSGKPVIPLCSTPMDRLPFDIRNLNILDYTIGQTTALRPRLVRRLKAVLGGAAN
jgi:hypothetical protein